MEATRTIILEGQNAASKGVKLRDLVQSHNTMTIEVFIDASLAFFIDFSNLSSPLQMPDFHIYCLKVKIKTNFEIASLLIEGLLLL